MRYIIHFLLMIFSLKFFESLTIVTLNTNKIINK